MVVKLERKRYILVEFFRDKPSLVEFTKQLRSLYARVEGEISLARSGIQLIDYKGSMLIIKCNHNSRDGVESALTLYSVMNLKIIRVSGTIKSIDRNLEESDDQA